MSEAADPKDHLAAENSQEVKLAWHTPRLDEIDYTATETGGGPSPFFDGATTYSVA